MNKNETILYRLRTVEKDFEHGDVVYDGVVMLWTVVDRFEPPVLYHEGISNYNALDDERKELAKERLNKLFTAREAIQFASYKLAGNGGPVAFEEVLLPLSVPEPHQYLYKEHFDFPEYCSYDLPFKVGGISWLDHDIWRLLTVELLQGRLRNNVKNLSYVPI
ncbi:hypothetical protein ACFL1G_06090 [Planctomycetota bacterium]